MGFFSGIRRRIKKIIPKEIRPALPFIAASSSCRIVRTISGIQSANEKSYL
jgi:hypothetical protein